MLKKRVRSFFWLNNNSIRVVVKLLNSPPILKVRENLATYPIKNPTVHLDRHFSLTSVIQSVATITIADGLKLRLFLTVFTYLYKLRTSSIVILLNPIILIFKELYRPSLYERERVDKDPPYLLNTKRERANFIFLLNFFVYFE